ncbi:MAG: hypothetical protein ACI8YQ_003556 [Polaribacter sp.]|jgi:uncharacterized protein (DUF1501 family)
MKRRTFLKNTSLFTLPGILGGFNVAAMPSGLLASMVNGDSDRVLVLIEMSGGNDGLNTFIPLDGYDNLANARPDVIIPENELLGMTDTIKLHPSMEGIRNLYEEESLALVQGVGYPNQNRSHFRSTDIWNTAVNADEYKSTGWIGRYLDDGFPGYPEDFPNDDCPDPFAVTMGGSISVNCQGVSSNFSHSILDVNNIGGLNTGVEADLPNDCYGSEMTFMVDAYIKSNEYSERVVLAADQGGNSNNNYPASTLGQQLKTVARLIDGGLQSRVYVLSIGGFDTHDGQVEEGEPTIGWHADLLRNLSDSIYAFQQDLKGLGLEERVVGMTYSEFGRKIISNAAFGTDHGSAAPMMVFGSCVNPTVIGANPTIDANVDPEEGVAMQYDFRSVYGSLLMDWFEVPEEKILTLLSPDFTYIPLVTGCIASDTEELITILNTDAFPNPFDNQFNIRFALEENLDVRIDLFDVVGKRVKQISNKSFTSGAHQIKVEGHDLSTGVYFVRIQAGNGVKSLRIVKQ